MRPRKGQNREDGFFFRLLIEGFFLTEAFLALVRLVARCTMGGSPHFLRESPWKISQLLRIWTARSSWESSIFSS
jgi:hypothetical protein